MVEMYFCMDEGFHSCQNPPHRYTSVVLLDRLMTCGTVVCVGGVLVSQNPALTACVSQLGFVFKSQGPLTLDMGQKVYAITQRDG